MTKRKRLAAKIQAGRASAYTSDWKLKKRARAAVAKMARELNADEALTFLICAATPEFLQSFTKSFTKRKKYMES